MGIHELSKVIGDHAAEAMSEHQTSQYFGRKVAVDASTFLYQFLVSIRQAEGAATLTDATGASTAHLIGLVARTVHLCSIGVKPVYVFDGAPPTLKSGELAKRSARAAEAREKLAALQESETADAEELAKYAKRTTRVTRQQSDEAKKLLELMGIPVVQAPCEAEAQCAAMAKAGLVWGVASEDMDALPLGSTILLRHMTASESKKLPVQEIHLDKVLQGLDMDMKQFIDLCILLGCDYCDTIKGIGRKRAVELIQKHKCIENVLASLDKTKYPTPESFPFDEVRELFANPPVTDPATLKLVWKEPDREGLIEFLVKEKGFNEERLKGQIEKLSKARKTPTQGRMTEFFKALPSNPPAKRPAPKDAKKSPSPKKRK